LHCTKQLVLSSTAELEAALLELVAVAWLAGLCVTVGVLPAVGCAVLCWMVALGSTDPLLLAAGCAELWAAEACSD